MFYLRSVSLVRLFVRSCACRMYGPDWHRIEVTKWYVYYMRCGLVWLFFFLYGKSNKMMLWTEGEIVAIILWPNKQFNYNNTASKQKLYSILFFFLFFFKLAWAMSSARWRQRWWWRWRCDAKTKDQVNMEAMSRHPFLRIRQNDKQVKQTTPKIKTRVRIRKFWSHLDDFGLPNSYVYICITIDFIYAFESSLAATFSHFFYYSKRLSYLFSLFVSLTIW